jgi:hypothetical protein
LKITISPHISISDCPPETIQQIKAALTIQNPKWLENQRLNRWNGKTTRWLRFWEDTPLEEMRLLLSGIDVIVYEQAHHRGGAATAGVAAGCR